MHYVLVGVCFLSGLLGKSTTFSMLSGLLTSDSGIAHLAGYDCVTQRREIDNVVGICPQFDIVWDDLTVYQHLIFYARAKGAHRDAEEALVQAIAEMVDLDGDGFHRPASALSGGMKR